MMMMSVDEKYFNPERQVSVDLRKSKTLDINELDQGYSAPTLPPIYLVYRVVDQSAAKFQRPPLCFVWI